MTPVIGLEVHIELATSSKMFCGCPADHFGKTPNTQTCPVCLGLPGSLPVPNKKAVEWTVLLGLALNCQINKESKFDRKNYFYPDLPKGYQISQYDQPFCVHGQLDKIRISRVHLEEDTGKLQHLGEVTLIDFNRSGVPLVEIVTDPDFRSVDEVDVWLKKLQRIVRYLGISNADMEKGSMRIEPSISLRPATRAAAKLPEYRVELKNINSFRFARKALEYEIERQQKEPHIQQTRGWNEKRGVTIPQREKEAAHDYRYFPEPDIPPVQLSDRQISKIRSQIPELPDQKLARFVKEYELTESAGNILVETKETADKFENLVKKEKEFLPSQVANAIINDRPLVAKGKATIPDDILDQVFLANPQAVADFKAGKQQAIGPLIGAVLAKGHFDKQLVIAKIRQKLV